MTVPSDSKIGELLAKLQELDPDAYMAWCELFDEIYDIDYDCIEWDSFAGAIYLLQGVIQDAIAARGWKWRANLYSEISSAVLPGSGKLPFFAQGETPAEAILAAYVAALEAEAAR